MYVLRSIICHCFQIQNWSNYWPALQSILYRFSRQKENFYHLIYFSSKQIHMISNIHFGPTLGNFHGCRFPWSANFISISDRFWNASPVSKDKCFIRFEIGLRFGSAQNQLRDWNWFSISKNGTFQSLLGFVRRHSLILHDSFGCKVYRIVFQTIQKFAD